MAIQHGHYFCLYKAQTVNNSKLKLHTMKKLLLGIFLLAGTATLHAQDSTKHKMHKKADSTMHKTDTMHHKMKGKMKKDSTK